MDQIQLAVSIGSAQSVMCCPGCASKSVVMVAQATQKQAPNVMLMYLRQYTSGLSITRHSELRKQERCDCRASKIRSTQAPSVMLMSLCLHTRVADMSLCLCTHVADSTRQDCQQPCIQDCASKNVVLVAQARSESSSRDADIPYTVHHDIVNNSELGAAQARTL